MFSDRRQDHRKYWFWSLEAHWLHYTERRNGYSGSFKRIQRTSGLAILLRCNVSPESGSWHWGLVGLECDRSQAAHHHSECIKFRASRCTSLFAQEEPHNSVPFRVHTDIPNDQCMRRLWGWAIVFRRHEFGTAHLAKWLGIVAQCETLLSA